MKIQSLSVVVPNPTCINHCDFCVSRMNNEVYKNQMDDNLPFFDLYLKDYLKRLEFARRNGCNTVMLTGNSEPQQNRKFMTYFGMFMQLMHEPFSWIEMQTTGVLIDRNYLRFLRNHVGVNLISLSISSFNELVNSEITHMPKGKEVYLEKLCSEIKEYDFALRLSVNLNKQTLIDFNNVLNYPEVLFVKCKQYGADQVTMRVLYTSGNNTPEDKWVEENALEKEKVESIKQYVLDNGKLLGILPYGGLKYSVNGMSTVIDSDCMAKGVDNLTGEKEDMKDTYKYLILRPNCKLYSQWDDPASLIF